MKMRSMLTFLLLTLSVTVKQMGITNSDAIIVIQINLQIVMYVVKSQNRYFGHNQIEIFQK